MPKKSHIPPTHALIEGIRSGNRTLLSQAITLVESTLPEHQQQAREILSACLKATTSVSLRSEAAASSVIVTASEAEAKQYPACHCEAKPKQSSIRIGITGIPGVGKSTFIESLGKHLTSLGHQLAVLAIDPSSTFSHGSILGDKTRMEQLAADPRAFIRPSPSAGTLGGVARKTRETIFLCEAAGFDVIFIETVGVGQSESAVRSMVDFFLLLMLPGAGDELQSIKRGIIEMADAIVINKADGDNLQKAKIAAMDYTSALHLFPPAYTGWMPVVTICSAKTGSGIAQVWDIIRDFRQVMTVHGGFQRNRMEQHKQTLYAAVEENLRESFFRNKNVMKMLHGMEEDLMMGRKNPYEAAQELMAAYAK